MTTQEHAKWVREKTKAASGYLAEKKKVDNAVAGKGFSNPPGFLYEIQTGLEFAVKQTLSDANYAILDEMVRQELKQSGVNYDLAYKNAMIIWESDKQVLLNDWNQELAMAKQAMAYDDEAVKMLALEVSKRSALLIIAKTAIEQEAEAIRLEMADLDATTGDYEIDLANRKVLTAQKKLEVIPYIQQIIAIEEEILDKDFQLTEKAKAIISKATEIVAKETEILGRDQELAVKAGLIADKILEITSKETEIVDKNQSLLAIADALADKIGEIVDKDAEVIAIAAEIASKNSGLIVYDQEITAKESASIIKDRSIITQLEIIADKSISLAAKEADVIGKNAELVEKQMVLVDKAEEAVIKDLAIVAKNEEIAIKEAAIVLLAESVAAKKTEIIAKNELLVASQTAILAIVTQIADKEKEVIAINQEIAIKQEAVRERLETINDGEFDLIVKENTLIAAKDAEVEASDQLIAKEENLNILIESAVLPEKQNLITAETAALALRESLVSPALTALIIVMDQYVSELAVQLSLYNEIAVIKTDTATIKEEQAAKMDLILGKREDIAEAMSILSGLLSGLSDYKLAQLAPKLSELVDVYAAYADTIQDQTALRVAIEEVRAQIYRLIPQQVQGELDILDAEVDLNTARLELSANQSATRTQVSLNRVTKIAQLTTDTGAYAAYRSAAAASELIARVAASGTVIDARETSAAAEFSNKVDNQLLVDEAGREADRDSADAYDTLVHDKVDIQTTKDGITASLTHLLSQD